MIVSKRKVVSLADHERELIGKVVLLLYELEDELEGDYDYTDLRDELETIKYKEYVIED
jgi:hypothetical protein